MNEVLYHKGVVWVSGGTGLLLKIETLNFLYFCHLFYHFHHFLTQFLKITIDVFDKKTLK